MAQHLGQPAASSIPFGSSKEQTTGHPMSGRLLQAL
jgi:hypothetical protein